jgi:hypothetical protein
MKKLLLFMTAGVFTFQVNAQYKPSSSVLLQNSNINTNAQRTATAENLVAGVANEGNLNTGVTAQKTTVGGSRWYNQAEKYAEIDNTPNIYGEGHITFSPIWQDSTVFYSGSSVGIAFLSYAQLFHPQSPIYNDPTIASSNYGQIYMEDNKPYTIDSINIRGWYERVDPFYVDTLIVTIVNETSTQPFTFVSYVGDPFVGTHNIDSVAFLLWLTENYGSAPLTQVSYGYSGNFLNAITFKIPLDDAVFADSVENTQFGGYIHEIAFPTNISVPAGGKASVSVTFKSGASYVAGDPITNYNHFYFINHETYVDNYQYYVTGDLNLSYLLHKDTTNTNLNSTLAYYLPAVMFTEAFNELINISWKVTCSTCDIISNTSNINETAAIKVGEAYPNPANNEIKIPVTLKENAEAHVTLLNTVGQVVYSTSLGQLSANQSKEVVIPTAHLANGVYMYSIKANGTQITNRIVVAH